MNEAHVVQAEIKPCSSFYDASRMECSKCDEAVACKLAMAKERLKAIIAEFKELQKATHAIDSGEKT